METPIESLPPRHAVGATVKIPRLAKAGTVILHRVTESGGIRVLVDIPEGLAIKRQWFDESDLA
jgi:hypothetical protein